MREEWRDIAGYEGFYQVSNMGRVRSLNRTFKRSDGTTATYKGRILKPAGRPYLHVYLSKNNVHSMMRVHRLVAEAFVSNPKDLECVDHIDCDKTNNRADNLRWCSHAQNIRYAQENGLLAGNFHYELLSNEKKLAMKAPRMVPIVRDDGKEYDCVEDAARDMGVTHGAISHVLRGLTKTCKGYSFKYKHPDS